MVATWRQPRAAYKTSRYAYPKGIVVSDQEMVGLNITRNEFHGEWNYTIHPSKPSVRAPNSG